MPVAPGDPAPDFTLPDQRGDDVTLADMRGKWVVLYFYPKDGTPGCTREACSFRDSHEHFAEAGAVVIGVSRDSIASHAEFAARHDLPFTLVSDATGALRGLYGVPRTLGLLDGRVTYVIDPDGIVRHVFDSQIRAARHQAEALAAIRRGSHP
ncbi:MAG: peroxiredoxin [Acidimicrobiia bacterium]|nr:peroxiredoxin [Acidimicrobiia bacterium]